MHVCAAKLRSKKALVTHGLYWAPVTSEEEADYLCAILNAPATTELARPLMSYGKDERDIHKHVWELPIEQYDSGNQVHGRIAGSTEVDDLPNARDDTELRKFETCKRGFVLNRTSTSHSATTVSTARAK